MFKIIKAIIAHTIDGENTVSAMIQSPEKVTTGKFYYVLDEISNAIVLNHYSNSPHTIETLLKKKILSLLLFKVLEWLPLHGKNIIK